MVCCVMSNGKEKELMSFSKPLVDRCGHTFPKYTAEERARIYPNSFGTRQDKRYFILK